MGGTDHRYSLRVLKPCFRHCEQRSGQERIIAVQIRNEVARGALEAFVDRIALPSVLFADPVGKLRFVFSDDVDAVVRAVSVYNEVLKIRITLPEDGRYSFL
jgi:hypothetical protein